MRLTTRLPATEVPEESTWQSNVGRNVPLRIGDLAYTAILESATRDGDDVLVTVDVPDSDFRWEVLTAAP